MQSAFYLLRQSLSGPHGNGLLGSQSHEVVLLVLPSNSRTLPTGLLDLIRMYGGGFKLVDLSASFDVLKSAKIHSIHKKLNTDKI